MSSIGDMFGGAGMGRQFLLWGVAMQLLGPVMTPITQEILDTLYPVLPSVPTPPEALADQVVRGVLDAGQGEDEAKHSGVNSDRFARMVHATGDPLAIGQLLEAYRRQLIPDEAGKGGPPSLMEGIRQSRLKDMWADTLKELQWLPLPVADAVEAVVKGQIDYPTGLKYAEHGGIREPEFKHLHDAAGNPPSVTELLELHKRGYIPMDGTGPDVLSVQQGIYEGRTKDKWWAELAKLIEYVPPPRTVTALEREGAITQAEALALYQRNGLTPELAAVYTRAASHQKLAHPRQLAEAQVLDMYAAKILTRDQAAGFLATLSYSPHDIDWLIALKDMHHSLAAIEKAITRIGTAYIARKVTTQQASAALDALSVPHDQRDHMLTTWKLEREATIKILTEAQIVAAWAHQIIDQGTAEQYLAELGYTPYDAWVLLSIHNKGPLDNPPAEGANVADRAQ